MELQHHFTSPFGFFTNKKLISGLKKHIYEEKVAGIDSKCATNLKKNLKESKFNFFNNDEKIIIDTKTFITDSLIQLLNKIQKEKLFYIIRFNECRFHIGKTNSIHETHTHPNCSWCGIYFIQIGDKGINKGSGETVFINPVYPNHHDWGTRYIDQLRIQPEDGLLVLFPSYLNHHQSIYTGNKDRIVIAFNMSVLLNKSFSAILM